MKLFDLRHPFFMPLWRRAVTCGVVGGWAAFEFVTGNPGWSAMFGAIALFCLFEFFIIFDPENYKEKSND